MLRKLLLTVVFLISTGLYASAQTGSISGTVTDANTGETLPGTNVYIKSLQKGDNADTDGNYEITGIPEGTYTLTASFVGYRAYKKKITVSSGSQTVDIKLRAGASLEETVVTGYGQKVKKREITGSIASVSSDEIEDVPVQNTAGLLQGRAAGVRVTTTSGTPGSSMSVQIRGRGSINAGTRPLYIIDGVQISYSNRNGTNSSSPLNAIAPENIESIEVLKDAAAAAIYGARAANGVVLVTTKSGKAGETQIKASYQRGAVTRIKNNEYFNRDQFIEYFNAGIQYDNPGASAKAVDDFFRSNYLPGYKLDPTADYSSLPNTDWFDYNSRTGISQNYKMTISGGTETNTYRVSGDYEDTDGYIPGNNYQNYSLNTSFNQKLSSNFSMREKITLSKQKFVGPCQDGFYINCPVSQAAFLAPLAKPYNDDGSYSTGFPFIGPSNNPAIIQNEQERRTGILQVLGSIGATYDFAPWLSFNTQFSMDYRREDERIYRNLIANSADNGSVTQRSAPTSNFQTSNTLNFNKTFSGVHNTSALIGFEYRRDYTRQIGASGIGLPNNLLKQLSSAAEATGVGGFTDEYRSAGYFGKLKYNYDERYYVAFTGRYDGSSRFGANNRFGFFPSVSASWAISQENFFNSNFVDDLKIRASYGTTGNSLIGRYAALGLYGTGAAYEGITALRPTQLANPDLTWEKAKTINLGLDYSFFSGRLSGALDVYRRRNSDLLLDRPLPTDSNFGSIQENVGEVQNRGIEFEVNSVNIQSHGFQWTTGLNFGINQNEVLELSKNKDALSPSGTQPVAVGHSIDSWKVVEYAGVNPADGRPFWYDKDGNLTYSPDTIDDRRWYDGSEEDLVGGFRNAFKYKGLSLSVFFQFSYGQRAIPQQITAFGIAQVGGSATNGLEERLTKAWRKPGDVEPFPAPSTAFTYPNSGVGYFLTGTDKIYDSSYIRLKDVTLSYNLPSTLTNKINIKGVRLYATGLNLVTWTSYIGFDPEIAGDITQGSIPNGRTIQGGIQVRF